MKKDLYLGVDTGGTGVKFVVTDSGGSVITSGEVPTDPASITVSMRRLATAVGGALGGEPDFPDLAGLGMACAGIVNSVTGQLGRSPNLPGWQGRNLTGDIGRVFRDVPVTVANDVNGALYGEFRQGAGRDCRNLVMIALGTGVGGGVIIDGKLVVGTHFGAGEIGHMSLDRDGPPCTCGSRGCLEAWAGSTGLLRRAREAATQGTANDELARLVARRGESLNTLDLAGLAAGGDVAATEIFAEAGRRLGQAIGNIVNLLDPDRVIVGGGVAQAGDLILKPCREIVPGLILAEEARNVPVVIAELGPLAAAVGAACLAREMEISR
ncbi:MAG: ROK family protein [Candidatus Krumholzibacteria bacterium]|nr:ROK family protein [Candidatus Krumholzibacteria bacterium]